jgi:hypothetical protein
MEVHIFTLTFVKFLLKERLSQSTDQNAFGCYFRPQMSENFYCWCKGKQLLLQAGSRVAYVNITVSVIATLLDY